MLYPEIDPPEPSPVVEEEDVEIVEERVVGEMQTPQTYVMTPWGHVEVIFHTVEGTDEIAIRFVFPNDSERIIYTDLEAKTVEIQ